MSLLLAGTTACSGDPSSSSDGGLAPSTGQTSATGQTGSSTGTDSPPGGESAVGSDSTSRTDSSSRTDTGRTDSTAPAVTPSATSSRAAPLPQLNATQVVSALIRAGYKCGRESTYAVCLSGPVAVWVLTGTHRRPPVLSLHSSGPVDTATDALAKDLPRVLELAHVNERAGIADWFGQHAGKTLAQTTVGEWQVELSTEVDTEEPGAHLTLMDKLCKANCQAE